MKSKKDLSVQINRIYRAFGNHRFYNRALSLVLLYNERMSNTEYNQRAYRLYMKCHYNISGNVISGREKTAERLLNAMSLKKYPQSVYSNLQKQ